MQKWCRICTNCAVDVPFSVHLRHTGRSVWSGIPGPRPNPSTSTHSGPLRALNVCLCPGFALERGSRTSPNDPYDTYARQDRWGSEVRMGPQSPPCFSQAGCGARILLRRGPLCRDSPVNGPRAIHGATILGPPAIPGTHPEPTQNQPETHPEPTRLRRVGSAVVPGGKKGCCGTAMRSHESPKMIQISLASSFVRQGIR